MNIDNEDNLNKDNEIKQEKVDQVYEDKRSVIDASLNNKISVDKKEVEHDIDLILQFKWFNVLFYIPFCGIWFWCYKYLELDKNLKSQYINREFFKLNVKWHLIFILLIFPCIFLNFFPLLFRFIIRTKILILAFYIINKK